MWKVKSFTFGTYTVDPERSRVICTYRVELPGGISKTFTDQLVLHNVTPDKWDQVPKQVLEPTLQALSLILGINYWCVFPTSVIKIENFSLSQEQADFWNEVYLKGLGEYFYDMKMDFRSLVAFPYDTSVVEPKALAFNRPGRALLLNGAGKDSILSAEILKEARMPFDFFALAPTPAHARVAALAGVSTIKVTRKRDPLLRLVMAWSTILNAYPSVTTFTFVATLLAELLGYEEIVFSNERSADFGNLIYRGLPVNHQWCKSTEAEQMVNAYIQRYITPSISTRSLLRSYSELEIVRRFVQYPKYLRHVTSCNNYFWLPRVAQYLVRRSYWCKRCPKCVFLFACFAAFLPKQEVVAMFGSDLFTHKHRLPLIKKLLGIEGFKPLDCVGEPEEMIVAMHLAMSRGEYAGEPAMQLFEKHFPQKYDFKTLEGKVFS